MDILNSYLKEKQTKNQGKIPKYGMRKLSVGFVSCFLGCAIFMAPVGVHAEEATDTPVAPVEMKAEAEKPVEATEAPAVKNEPAAVKENVSEEAPKAENVSSEEKSAEANKDADASDAETSEIKSEEKQDDAVNDKTEPNEAQTDGTETAAEDLKAESEEKQDDAKAEPNVEAQTDETETADKDSEEKTEEKPQAAVSKESEAKDVDAPKLDVSEEVNPKALKEGETTEDAITNVEITIGGAKNGQNTEIVNPTALPGRVNGGNTDINLEARVDFDIPEGTKAGRTFDFVVSDNVNLHGVLKSEEEGQPVVFDGEEIATAEKLTDGRNGYKYTFNEKVDNLKDIRVRIIYPLFIDPDKVPMGTKEYEIGKDGKYKLDNEGKPILKADNKEKVSVTVAGKTASKDYTVEYESEVFDEKPTGPTLSGIADIDNVTDNKYNHTIYVNPTADQMLNGSHVTVENEKGYNTITFDEDVKNSVKVYKVKDPNKLPLSFGNHFDDGNYEDVTSKANVKLVKDNNNADLNKLVVDVKQGNTNKSMPFDDKDFDKSTYVITYTGKRTPNKAFKTNTIFTADWRKANGNAKNLSKLGDQTWKWTNEIVIDDAEAIALANKTYSLGDKVWVDADGDGSQGDSEEGLAGVKVILKGINMSDRETTTDEKGNYKFEGLRNGKYTVEFEIKSGYAPTTANAKGTTDINNSDAIQAQGSDVATATGTIQGADNMNVDFGVVLSQKGTFKEHHIYQTVDEDGKVISTDDKLKKDSESTGKESEEFTTQKKDEEGYTLVKVEGTEGTNFDQEGTAQKTNYKKGETQEVTYTYQKKVTTQGIFKEHHIYQTVDEDGKVISTDDKLKKDSESTGKETEEFTTSKKDEEGYTLVKVEGTEGTNFKQDGSAQKTNYKKGETQEVTYIYQKRVTTPSKPVEPSTPVNPTPSTPDEPTEWTPLKPVDPETPDTPDTPDTPVKEEPKNPEPQTPEEPAQPEQPAEPKPADEEVEKPAETKVEDEESLGATDPADREEEINQPKNYKENEEDLEGKAPQTFDAGVAPYAGLAGLASGVFAYLESKKRRNK